MRRIKIISIILAVALLMSSMWSESITYSKAGSTYTISPGSAPCDRSKKYTTYNKYTRHYS